MTNTTSRSRHASFAVTANGTAPFLSTRDDLLHLLHVLPHVIVTGPSPCPPSFVVLVLGFMSTLIGEEEEATSGATSATTSLWSPLDGDPELISCWYWSESRS
jgi:hypothetical protein